MTEGTRNYSVHNRHAAKPRRDNVAELVRALMDGPKTADELDEFVDLSKEVVRAWLRSFHEAGVIRISERLPGNLPVYEHQTSPFALSDVPLKCRKPSRRVSQRGVRVATL